MSAEMWVWRVAASAAPSVVRSVSMWVDAKVETSVDEKVVHLAWRRAGVKVVQLVYKKVAVMVFCSVGK